MKYKAQTNAQRVALHFEGIIKQIGVIDRYGAALAIGEACETFAGVMAEVLELLGMVETCKDTQLKKWMEERGTNKRLYAGHFTAIRDVLRLAKLTTELIEMRNDLLNDCWQNWLNEVQGKPNTDAQVTDDGSDEQLNTSEEKTEDAASSEETTQNKGFYF